jgi:osmotically-inducible protein OsmY
MLPLEPTPRDAPSAPPPAHRPPHAAEAAERRLRQQPYLALREVSCACRDGVLTLRGHLPSYYLKQLAQEAVADTPGVGRVENQIDVTAPAGPGVARA